MTRRLLVLAAVLAVVAGCSVLRTGSALGDAGFSVPSISSQTLNGFTTLRVAAQSPPGVPRGAAIDEAERIVWRTQSSPVDRLELELDGVETTAGHDELAARFGPRDPALDASRIDLVLFVAITVGLGVVLLLVVVLAVVVAPWRRRRFRAGTPPPLWAATDLVGPRVGQFVLDLLVWGVPTVVVLNVTWFVEAASRGVTMPVYLAWAALSLAWGWYLYAYRPARRGGQTFGMRRTRLRVVTLDGRPAGVGRHTVRWASFVLDAVPYGLVGLATMTASARHQRLGDVLAGTVVIRA